MNSSFEELAIIIPVYNEGANFPQLWSEIVGNIHSPFKAYVVYDFDQDDTIAVASQIIASGEQRLSLVKNNIRTGVVGAICTGFKQINSGPCLVVMADLCDDLKQVDKMLELYNQGFHIVVASRSMPGGQLVGGPWLKQTFSRLAGLTLHWFSGIPTHDATNAFKLYDAHMLQQIAIESCGGFELSLEITVKAFLAGYKITELPTTWRDRMHGQSRFKMWAWMPSYLRWYLYALMRQHN